MPKCATAWLSMRSLQEARSDNYDLVVIGAHRDEGLPRFLLDDLSHELVLDIDRAILVVQVRVETMQNKRITQI
jgi:nucleotide-binding universal stress UspA family protein